MACVRADNSDKQTTVSIPADNSDKQTTVSIASASHSLSETSPGVYNVIITDSATGNTYIVVRNVGGTSFVDVSIPANVIISYSNRMISIGSDLYAAGFHLAVLQSAPLVGTSADTYLGDYWQV